MQAVRWPSFELSAADHLSSFELTVSCALGRLFVPATQLICEAGMVGSPSSTYVESEVSEGKSRGARCTAVCTA